MLVSIDFGEETKKTRISGETKLLEKKLLRIFVRIDLRGGNEKNTNFLKKQHVEKKFSACYSGSILGAETKKNINFLKFFFSKEQFSAC